VHQLLNVFIEILMLRKGPQALPASGLLLGIVFGLHFLLGIILYALEVSLGMAVLGAAVGTGLLAAVTRGTLALRGLSHRFIQTATAMAGSDFLLVFPTLPLVLWQHDGALTTIVLLLATGWGLVVFGHIFRHALGIPAWKGFAVAVGYFLISVAAVGPFIDPGA
jgi:hypothetical protein